MRLDDYPLSLESFQRWGNGSCSSLSVHLTSLGNFAHFSPRNAHLRVYQPLLTPVSWPYLIHNTLCFHTSHGEHLTHHHCEIHHHLMHLLKGLRVQWPLRAQEKQTGEAGPGRLKVGIH